jgi:hypothetical protein
MNRQTVFLRLFSILILMLMIDIDPALAQLRRFPRQLQEPVKVGVFYMPSWNVEHDPSKPFVNSFWSCLTPDSSQCAFIKDPHFWGEKGRIYTAQDPRPSFMNRKPHHTLGGFYKMDDPVVIRKQIEYMKNYGIDFLAYDWFWGLHYYHHTKFPPQADLYYPQDWEVDLNNSGRVKVPGVEQWAEPLHAIVKVNDSLPPSEQIQIALNWCADSEATWQGWLGTMDPKNNLPVQERASKELYLQVHDKMTLLWIDKYFAKPYYLKSRDGRPVVYFYFPQDTAARAAYYGITLKELMSRSNQLAIQRGHKGIKFIAVLSGAMLANEVPQYGLPQKWVPNDASKPWAGGQYIDRISYQDYLNRLKGMGFEGLTSYVYHSYNELYNKSYADMLKTYNMHWYYASEKFKHDTGFEYQVPVAMGWDNRPSGGTWYQKTGVPSHPERDFVHSNKGSFKTKLEIAKSVVNKYRHTNGDTVTICCWNEYTEGNYIEPTEGHGFDYLEAIQEVFMPRRTTRTIRRGTTSPAPSVQQPSRNTPPRTQTIQARPSR